MSDPMATDHLGLPYLAPSQAQKHVTHNEALRSLDIVVQLAVLDSSLAAPPSTPAAGDRYIVADDATGDWDGHDGEIAAFVDDGWLFAAPETGWLAFDRGAEALLVRGDDGWASVGSFVGAFDRLGINTDADDTNRLAVRSAAVLFTGVEAGEGGTGDIRFIISKEADGDTATLLFQSGFSGRAEVGLAGDTDFVFKVSPDGSSWTEAIRIDKDTGLATILYDNGASGLAATSVQDAIDEVAASSIAPVTSIFARTGAVVAATHDYDASQIDNDSGVSGASVKDALDALASSVAGKQDGDSDLTALAGLSAAGLVARTGAGTAAVRTLTAPAAGITVSNGDGVAGNPTLALANDLAALEGLGSTGLAARTAADTWAQRSVAASTGLSVSNGSGVSGNPTVGLDINSLTEDTSPDPAADFWLTYDSSATAHKKVKPTSLVRERLAANRTYYVRTDGSDSNAGLANTSGGAFLTLLKAWNVVCGLDLAGFAATIQVGDGTYSAGIVSGLAPFGGGIVVNGNSGTPSNVVISTTSASCFGFSGVFGGSVTIQNLKMQTTTAGDCINHSGLGVLSLGAGLVFGASAGGHVVAGAQGAHIQKIGGTYTVNGNAAYHMLALQGYVEIVVVTVTLSGTPAFTVFAYASRIGFVSAAANTYSGSATGARYVSETNSVIYTSGGGASYFPGGSAGSTATGGQYV